MTVIAFKDGHIAADRAVSLGDTFGYSKCKIIRSENGYFAAFAGSAIEAAEFEDWVRSGCLVPPPKQDDPDWVAILVDSNNKKIYYAAGGNLCEAPIDQPHAIGSGCGMALVAMDIGCSAEDAVKAAAYRMGVAHHGIDVVKCF